MYRGIAGSNGIGIGKAKVFIEYDDQNIVQKKEFYNTKDEIARVEKAIDLFIIKTNNIAKQLELDIGKEDANILRSHCDLISNAGIKDRIFSLIENKNMVAEMATKSVFDKLAKQFKNHQSKMLKQRAADMQDIKNRLINILVKKETIDFEALPDKTVLVVRRITPSMAVTLNPSIIFGVVSESGNELSHSAILMRAKGIPTVFGLKGICEKLNNGDEVIVDGTNGDVFVNPNKEKLVKYKNMSEEKIKEKKQLEAYKKGQTVTADGIRIGLYGNVSMPEDVDTVYMKEADGIGLFRTEFLFMNKEKPPTEEEQFQIYSKVVKRFKEKPTVIRLLDVGDDKKLPYFCREENLNFRQDRFFGAKGEVYKTQIRACIRAGVYGNLKILVPYVKSIEELCIVKQMVRESIEEFQRKKIKVCEKIPIGVMIETIEAYRNVNNFAKEAAFFNIGTNDLTAEILGISREKMELKKKRKQQKEVFDAIEDIVKSARKTGISVVVCGEMATNEQCLSKLLRIGVQNFSVPAINFLEMRRNIQNMKVENEKTTKK